MIEVVIDSVRVNLMTPQRLIVLREVNGNRYLPIWVGPFEAEAITVGLQEVAMMRPLTHDLIGHILAAFQARLVRVEIVSLREDVFYGNIVLNQNGKEIEIDSRPSDAIALAVRARVPIYVHPAVMSAASITPEKDIRERPSALISDERSSPPAPQMDEASDRLDVFKDFLSKLDLDLDNPDSPPPSDQPN